MSLFKKIYFYAGIIVMMSFVAVSCDDTTDTLGASLTEVSDMVEIQADEFNVASKSVAANNIVSRSRDGFLGKFKDTETGNYITCNYMTQFCVMDKYQFPGLDTIYIDSTKYDATVNKRFQVEADSCTLVLYISKSIRDSLALMKVTANELSEPYEESQTYNTDFDPEAEHMVRTDAGSVHSQLTYTTSNRIYTETQRSSSTFTNRINLSLNDSYTDKQGVTYNNYGTYLMRKYYEPEHRGSFNTFYGFAHDICPGFYIKHQGGIGSIATIYKAQIIVYYKGFVEKDSIIVMNSSFAGTEEVIQKTTIKQNENVLNKLITDESCTYLMSPAGILTELTLPVDDILNEHNNDTINTVRLFVPRINNTESNDYSLSVPQTLLLIPTDSIQSFFSKGEVADYRNSYIATYSSTTNGYTYGNISLLVSNLNTKRKEAQNKGETLSDNWNKVMLIPVSTTYTTVSTSTSLLTKVTHDMSFASTKLKRGKDDSNAIKVSVIYSKFKE